MRIGNIQQYTPCKMQKAAKSQQSFKAYNNLDGFKNDLPPDSFVYIPLDFSNDSSEKNTLNAVQSKFDKIKSISDKGKDIISSPGAMIGGATGIVAGVEVLGEKAKSAVHTWKEVKDEFVRPSEKSANPDFDHNLQNDEKDAITEHEESKHTDEHIHSSDDENNEIHTDDDIDEHHSDNGTDEGEQDGDSDDECE